MYPGGATAPAAVGTSERGGSISSAPALHALQAVLDTLTHIAQASDDGLQISLQCGAVEAVARALQVIISPRDVPELGALWIALQTAMHPLVVSTLSRRWANELGRSLGFRTIIHSPHAGSWYHGGCFHCLACCGLLASATRQVERHPIWCAPTISITPPVASRHHVSRTRHGFT